MNEPQAVDVAELIDERPITGFQIAVFVLCALAAVLDGADRQRYGRMCAWPDVPAFSRHRADGRHV